MLRWIAYAVIALLAIVATALLMAPAQWLASAVHRGTGSRVELAEATGSVWRGQATLVLSPGGDAGIARVSLPERLSWQLAPWRLLSGTAQLTLSHPSALLQPLSVQAHIGGRIEVGPTTLRLPAAVLVGLGAPFNTLKPGGLLTVNWQRLEMQQGRLQGDIVSEWQFASSALTPVAPFGHYRLSANGGFPGTRLNLLTITGPLELTGNGTIDEGGRLRFSGLARAASSADPSTKAQLSGLVSLLGRRDGDTALLSIGN